MGRINRGDGDGGDPARSPSGHASFRWPNRSNWRAGQEFAPRLARPLSWADPCCATIDFSLLVQDIVFKSPILEAPGMLAQSTSQPSLSLLYHCE